MHTQIKNNVSRLRTLLSMLDNEIADENLIGIAIWSNEAVDCMLDIEIGNKLFRSR